MNMSGGGNGSGGGCGSGSSSGNVSNVNGGSVVNRRRQIMPSKYSFIKKEDDQGKEKGGEARIDATASLAAASPPLLKEETEGFGGEATDMLNRQLRQQQEEDQLLTGVLTSSSSTMMNGIKGAATAAADAAIADDAGQNTSMNNVGRKEKEPWELVAESTSLSPLSAASTTITPTEKENNDESSISSNNIDNNTHKTEQPLKGQTTLISKTTTSTLSPQRRRSLDFTASTKTNTRDCLITRPPPPDPSAFTSAMNRPVNVSSSSSLHTFSDTHTGHILSFIARKAIPQSNRSTHSGSALAGFFSLLLVTCANYMLGPMRDAAALAVGVSHIPSLTLASTVLALASSVPVGWLFEAPDPRRRRLWKKMGLTRGETQGTSLALFYRCFGIMLVGYALGFKVVEVLGTDERRGGAEEVMMETIETPTTEQQEEDTVKGFLYSLFLFYRALLTSIARSKFGKLFYVAFFLVVHLMKLHSLSLIWGVTSEAMEYEEQAELREKKRIQIARMNIEWGFDANGGNKNNYGGSNENITPTTTGSTLRRRKNSEGSCKTKPKLMTIQSGERLGSEDLTSQESNTAETTTASSSSSSATSGNGNSGSTAGSGGGKRSRARLKRLAFVGFGGTLGGIVGSIITSLTAHILHMSGLLLLAAILLELSANLSIELGRIMKRHWEEEQQQLLKSTDNLVALAGKSGSNVGEGGQSGGGFGSDPSTTAAQKEIDPSMKRVSSLGSMKRVSSGNSLSGIRRAKSAGSINTLKDPKNPNAATEPNANSTGAVSEEEQVDDNSFSQRLLRGVTTILRSRLLMAIFIYNALYASTSVLLSFQRAELVANRDVDETSSSAESDTAFLAKINIASSVAVFVLQASGMGAFIANSCGQRGTLSLIPIVRLCGVLLLAWWHIKGDGKPPNLILFLLLDEFTKVVNFAVAKPVRESLWRGLSNEARYEAKPIVDTLANRWGGGSAAFCVSAVDKIIDFTNLGQMADDGTKSLFGFPPILVLCMIVAVWWTVVSADLGHIRHRIDLELKKHQ